MKNRKSLSKIIITFLVLVMTALSLAVLSACDGAYLSDDEYHWMGEDGEKYAHSYALKGWTWETAEDGSFIASATVECFCGHSLTVPGEVHSVLDESACLTNGAVYCTATAEIAGKVYTSKEIMHSPYFNHHYVNNVCINCGHVREGAPYYTAEKDGTPTSTGGYVAFGEYPQSRVSESLENTLNKEFGTEDGWTAFDGFYAVDENNVFSIKEYFFYKDVEYQGETYRGVYFTERRPNVTGGIKALEYYQAKHGYVVNDCSTAYWFKYEPILWQILDTFDNSARIVSVKGLDTLQYYHVRDNANPFRDVVVDGETVSVAFNSFEHSDVRAWLNDGFYNNFTEDEKAHIGVTTYANPSNAELTLSDKITLLSVDEYNNTNYFPTTADKVRYSSDYALSLGVDTNVAMTITPRGNYYYQAILPNGGVYPSIYSDSILGASAPVLTINFDEQDCPHADGNAQYDGTHHWNKCAYGCGEILNYEEHEHNFVFVWAKDGSTAEARFDCECGHSTLINATVTSEITLEPTCQAMGKTTYSARVEFNGETFVADKTVEDIATVNHKMVEGECIYCHRSYFRVNEDGTANDESGAYVLFGSYPQTRADTDTETALNSQFGIKDGWTAYEDFYRFKHEDILDQNGKTKQAVVLNADGTETYRDTNDLANAYIAENGGTLIHGKGVVCCCNYEEDYTFYKDVEYNGERYRGVYFTKYRPSKAGNAYKYTFYQDDYDYLVNTYDEAYWFKYEPMKWHVVDETDGIATLYSSSILDAMHYYNDRPEGSDSATCYREVVDENGNTLSVNYQDYEFSDIRTWLNTDFYDYFYSVEKKYVQPSVLVNDTDATRPMEDNVYLCKVDEIATEYYLRSNSDYSFAMGSYNAAYFTRTYSTVKRGNLIVVRSTSTTNIYCDSAFMGVAPCLKIKL